MNRHTSARAPATRRRWPARLAMLLVVVSVGALLRATAARAADETWNYGRFGTTTLYRPDSRVASVALFISGDGGWNSGVVEMARALAAHGALVIGIDIRHYLAQLAAAHERCIYPAADFEDLAHAAELHAKLDDYTVPVVVGYSSGASLVYALLAQAPPGTFAGGLSLGFSPDLALETPPCRGSGLEYDTGRKGAIVVRPSATMPAPWIALQGRLDQVVEPSVTADYVARTPHAQLVDLPDVGHGFSKTQHWMPQYFASYATLTAPEHSAASSSKPSPVADLPVVEVPANATGAADRAHAHSAVLLLTGDGGWAGIDRELAAGFIARGVPVLGLNTLKYFWRAKTPAQTASDVARLARYALEKYRRTRIILVGYSFGADVLPFVVNRLPADVGARIASLHLLGLSRRADFEIHVADWWRHEAGQRGQPVTPEIARLPAEIPKQCYFGRGEDDDPCATQSLPGFAQVEVGDGHHLGGDTPQLVTRILDLPARRG